MLVNKKEEDQDEHCKQTQLLRAWRDRFCPRADIYPGNMIE